MVKARNKLNVSNLLSNKLLKEHDLSKFSTFFLHHNNPIIYICYDNYKSLQVVAFNISFKEHFSPEKETTFNFNEFIKKFSFFSEPINILGSKDIIKALYKKNGKIYQFISHVIDNEYLFLELININENSHLINNKNQEYYDLVNLLPEIIFELNNDYTFGFLNESALQIFGFTSNHLKNGIHVSKVILKREYSKFKTYLDLVFEGKNTRERVITIVDKDKKLLTVELYFSLIKKGVKITGIRGIAIDITHRKKIEEKLLQAKKRVEEADKLKTAFLMNMSHEIRTPLNSVLGYTQLLIRKIKDPELLVFLRNIKASGKGLLQLFNDLLDLSKIYAGKLDVFVTEINLNKTLYKLSQDFQTEIDLKKKDIHLKTLLALEEKDAILKMDEERLKQIFTSLFNNSLKFTNSGLIEFGYQIVGTNIHFFIRDTGIGMDKKIKNEIFDFFYQTDAGINSRSRGTGIGLAITKGIIERMNGKIWLESEIDKGTLFNFTLPYYPAEKEWNKDDSENTSKRNIDLKNKTILIVEDDPDNYFILNSFLEQTNARIIHASDGKEALEIYENEKIDVIFMDINIPVINGCEVTKRIRSEDRNVIILAQTAYVQKEDKINCYAAGCDAFIEKPINGELLLETLSGFLSRPRS